MQSRRDTGPLLVTPAAGARWADALLWTGAISSVFVLAVLASLLPRERTGLIVTAVALALTFAVIGLVLPRRYEVWPDHLTVVLPLWAWRLPVETIAEVRRAEVWKAFGYIGVRFTTAPSASVEVRRVKAGPSRPNVILSPVDRDEFIRVLASRLEARAGRGAVR